MDPYRLLEKGKHEEALRLYRQGLKENPNDGALLDGYPDACLCNGLFEEALEGYLQLNKRAKLKPVGCKYPYVMHVGVVQWLVGRREEALQTLRFSVEGLVDGTIEYATASRGASQALLLWYAGVFAPDAAARDCALDFMQGLVNSEHTEFWPGPVAEYVIGSKTERQLLRGNFGSRERWVSNLSSFFYAVLPKNVQRHIIFPVQLSEALFYIGVKSWTEGNKEEYQRAMEQCVNFPAGTRPFEWFLAKQEMARFSGEGEP
jgi:tetratricopeptide (TPR) repeat protein